MDSFRDLISKTAHEKIWFLKKSLTFKVNDIWDANRCCNIIREYLGRAGTIPENGSLAEVLDSKIFTIIDNNRYQHILMTYFFGLAIYNNCKTIKDAVDKNFCNNEKYKDALTKHQDAPFAYLWFLICLFHDLGYQFENDFSRAKNDFGEFSNLKNKTSWTGISILDHLVDVPGYYSGIIENYFLYRIKAHEVYDHGITGGMQLYYDLCRIRNEKFENEQNRAQVIEGYWRPSLDEVFAYAASVVVCHNIFFASNSTTKMIYERYDLSPLINVDKSKKITIQDFPVFFLFCLVDSIEPVKIVKDIDLLDRISYDIKPDNITCQINLKCGCGDRLYKSMYQLNDWLCSVQNKSGENKILTIKI